MNEKNARFILEIDETTKLTEELIKKKYRNKALKCHPDKNKSEDANEEFIELKNAYDYIGKKIGINIVAISYSELLYDFLKDCVNTNNSTTNTKANLLNTIIEKLSIKCEEKIMNVIIENLSVKCEEKIMNVLENIDKEVLLELYKLIITNEAIFRHIDKKTIEKLKRVIDDRIKNDELIILNPTIDDLLEFNLYKYKIRDRQLIIPLWHRELTYDISNSDILVKCNPILKDNHFIDEYNNIHIKLELKLLDIWNEPTYKFNIGKKAFEFQINKLAMQCYQIITLKSCGIARINKRHIYNVTELGDINLHVYIKES